MEQIGIGPLEGLAGIEFTEDRTENGNQDEVTALLRRAADFLEERDPGGFVYDVTFNVCEKYVSLTICVRDSVIQGEMPGEEIDELEARLVAGGEATNEELQRYLTTLMPWHDEDFIPMAIGQALIERGTL